MPDAVVQLPHLKLDSQRKSPSLCSILGKAKTTQAMKELDQWVCNWNKKTYGDSQEKCAKPIIIKGDQLQN